MSILTRCLTALTTGTAGPSGCEEQQISYTALFYFSVATILLGTGYIAVFWLFNTKFIRYYLILLTGEDTDNNKGREEGSATTFSVTYTPFQHHDNTNNKKKNRSSTLEELTHARTHDICTHDIAEDIEGADGYVGISSLDNGYSGGAGGDSSSRRGGGSSLLDRLTVNGGASSSWSVGNAVRWVVLQVSGGSKASSGASQKGGGHSSGCGVSAYNGSSSGRLVTREEGVGGRTVMYDTTTVHKTLPTTTTATATTGDVEQDGGVDLYAPTHSTTSPSSCSRERRRLHRSSGSYSNSNSSDTAAAAGAGSSSLLGLREPLYSRVSTGSSGDETPPKSSSLSPLRDGNRPHNNNMITFIDTIKRVFRVIYLPALSVMFTFTVTISVFPSVIVRTHSQNASPCARGSSSRVYNDLFVPIMFLLFNLFDFIGRLSAESRLVLTVENVWIPAVLRVVFIPAFLLCQVNDSTLPLIFRNDFYPIFFMIIFAFSNGYVASAAMILGASVAEKHLLPEQSSLAGTLMIFCLTFGLCLGSVASFVTAYISS